MIFDSSIGHQISFTLPQCHWQYHGDWQVYTLVPLYLSHLWQGKIPYPLLYNACVLFRKRCYEKSRVAMPTQCSIIKMTTNASKEFPSSKIKIWRTCDECQTDIKGHMPENHQTWCFHKVWRYKNVGCISNCAIRLASRLVKILPRI